MTEKKAQLIDITQNPYNAGTPLATLLEDITPLELVYVRNHFEVPRIDETAWTLNLNGAGRRTISFSYSEIRAMSPKKLTCTLECAGNGRKSMNPVPEGTGWDYGAISIVEFTGTPLSNVIERGGTLDDVVEVAFHGADQGEVEPNQLERFVRSLPLDTALDPDTLLAWEMNGQPLTPNHGFPIRLVVPNWYGMASVKWLNQIEFLTEPFNGYFQNEHYVYVDEEGTQQGAPVRYIRPRSLISSPSDGEILRQQKVEIAGICWSGKSAIDQVEVSVDGGKSWFLAELEAKSSDYGVQKWRYWWKPEAPGRYSLVSKATDSLGNSQPSAQVWNRLGYGNNGPQSIVVSVI